MKRTRWTRLLLAALLLWLLFIWGNSLHPVEASREQSGQIRDLLVPLLDALEIPPELRNHVVRKAAHFIEFFVLGLLWAAVFRGRHLPLILLCCLCTAALDEALQFLAPGRGPQLQDVALDFMGSLTAVLPVTLILYLARARHKSP